MGCSGDGRHFAGNLLSSAAMRHILQFRSGLRSLLLVGLGATSSVGCAVDDFAGTEAFACSSSGQCLSDHHCDAVSRTCKPGPASDDGGVNRDAAVPADGARPDADADRGVISDEGVVVADGSYDAVADAAGPEDAALGWDGDMPDLGDPDQAVPPPRVCDGQPEFFDCSMGNNHYARCVRGECCGFAELTAACNPTGPGFPSPYGTPMSDRFLTFTVPFTGIAEGQVEPAKVVFDRGTGLVWLPLPDAFNTPEAAQRACQNRTVVVEDLPVIGDSALLERLNDRTPFRLPDAYELWSLFSFIDPGEAPVGSPAEVFEAAGFSPIFVMSEGHIMTRVRTTNGRTLAMDYASRAMMLADVGQALRVLCVVGGRRDGPGTANERRNVGGAPGNDWRDTWSRRTWRYLETIASPSGVEMSFGQRCQDYSARSNVPSVFDLVSRLDVAADGEDGNQLAARDRYLNLDIAGDVPAIVAEPVVGPALAMQLHRVLVASLGADVLSRETDRKLYCLTPPTP